MLIYVVIQNLMSNFLCNLANVRAINFSILVLLGNTFIKGDYSLVFVASDSNGNTAMCYSKLYVKCKSSFVVEWARPRIWDLQMYIGRLESNCFKVLLFLVLQFIMSM